MPSFDVVSRIDLPELDNAISGVKREINQRYDFKGSSCDIERSGNNISLLADNEVLLRQMRELVFQYCAKRGVDNDALEYKSIGTAAKGTIRQEIVVHQGIDQKLGKDIVRAIKATKLKVQATLQGEEIRIDGKKRDDLQETIDVIKGLSIDLPLQYVNFRD